MNEPKIAAFFLPLGQNVVVIVVVVTVVIVVVVVVAFKSTAQVTVSMPTAAVTPLTLGGIKIRHIADETSRNNKS